MVLPFSVLNKFPGNRPHYIFIFIFILASSTVLAISNTSWATSYYSSPSGSGSTCSMAIPCSLNTGLGKLVPGDTLYLRGGSYVQQVSFSTSGTAMSPITISGYTGETAIIDGILTLPTDENGFLFTVKGAYVKVTNLEITRSYGGGVMMAGEHGWVDNVYSHHNRHSGIHMSGSYGLIENSRTYYNSTQYEWGVGSKWSSGIAVSRTPSYCTIRKNLCWNTWGQGINTYESYYTTVEDNISWDNMSNFYVSDAHHVLFQRNLAYHTPGNLLEPYVAYQVSLLIGDEKFISSDNTFINNFVMGGHYVISIGSGSFEGGLVANNTFVNATTYFASPYTVRIGSGTYKNARFQNNIILQEGSIPIAVNAATGITFENNNWSKTMTTNVQGTGDVVGDPKLTKSGPTGPGLLTPEWFKILDNSPARDRAKVISQVAEDFFKSPRDGSPDMGAHEISTSAQPSPPTDLKIIY